jgi:hypothetical protein
MNHLDNRLNILDRSPRQHAMTEIKYMSGTALRRLQNAFDLLPNFLDRRAQDHWIEITLNAHIVSDTLPGIVEIDAPVQADDIAPRLPHQLKQGSGTGAKMDDGDTER